MNSKKFYHDMGQTIAKHKRLVMSVCPRDTGEIGFTYTIGNQERGLPELLIIGFWGSPYGGLLDTLSDMMIERGEPFAHGELVSLGAKYPVKLINANDQAQREYTIQCGQFYGSEDYGVQQVVACDREGRYPDDPQCSDRYKVPLLQTATVQ